MTGSIAGIAIGSLLTGADSNCRFPSLTASFAQCIRGGRPRPLASLDHRLRRPGGRAATYVNGRLLKEWKLAKGPVVRIDQATIGNWKPLENWDARPLFGSIDEFAIFAGA